MVKLHTNWAFPRRIWSRFEESSHWPLWLAPGQPHQSLWSRKWNCLIFFYSHPSTWWGRKALQGHWLPRWSFLLQDCVQSPLVCCHPCLLLSSSPSALPSWKLQISAFLLPSCPPHPVELIIISNGSSLLSHDVTPKQARQKTHLWNNNINDGIALPRALSGLGWMVRS